MAWTIHHGDCRDVMAKLDAESVDAVICDPPYGLSFMGKEWDSFKEGDIAMRRNPQMDAVNTGASRQGGRQRACADYQKRQARDMLAFQDAMNAVFIEALRVAKPGAHLLAFGGTRTYHRLACAIEDAGWEIRDCVMWVYGSGFPKSHNVGNAVDKHFGCDNRGHAISSGSKIHPTTGQPRENGELLPKYEGRTDEGKRWQGWGTALKPAWEPIIVARKPLCGTVAENVLRHGTGAINVDGCRIGTNGEKLSCSTADPYHGADGSQRTWNKTSTRGTEREQHAQGRWPANVIHDGSDEVVGLFPQAKGMATQNSSPLNVYTGNSLNHSTTTFPPVREGYNDSGSAARFFYCAKTSKADRNDGCETLSQIVASVGNTDAAGRDSENVANYIGGQRKRVAAGLTPTEPRGNHHPTVKPTALMRYLCRLVTPPGGVVLDPFTGSGSTGKAAVLEGFGFIGIERELEYVGIAKARIAAAEASAVKLFG